VPLLHAHRGAASEQPENTLPSFARALELGADALETDLHLTADGHVVASHDATLARMAGVPVEIRRATLDELRRCDVGWGFVDREGGRPFEGRGVRVPTLEEILDAFPGVPLNVDVKQRSPSMVGPVLDLLRRKRAEDRVLVASFDGATLRAVRAAGYPGRTGLGPAEVLRLYAMPLAALRAAPLRGAAVQIPPRARGLRLDTPGFVRKCHALGLRLDYWTINDPEEAGRLLTLGADGIMTDDPAAIAPVFKRWREAARGRS
jgi:glycerophosphoryl diester phosphodiesterase